MSAFILKNKAIFSGTWGFLGGSTVCEPYGDQFTPCQAESCWDLSFVTCFSQHSSLLADCQGTGCSLITDRYHWQAQSPTALHTTSSPLVNQPHEGYLGLERIAPCVPASWCVHASTRWLDLGTWVETAGLDGDPEQLPWWQWSSL